MEHAGRTYVAHVGTPVTHWAVSAFAGVLGMFRYLQREGFIFSPQDEIDLRIVQAEIDNIMRRNRSEAELPLPGGASNPLANHLYQK